MNHSPEYLHSELPAINLFQKLGYQYYDGAKQDERDDITQVILESRLKSAIKRINPWIDDNNIHKSFTDLTSMNGASLMEINEKVWHLLRDGKTYKQTIDGKEEFRPVKFIDYENPDNNDFLVVNQMKYHGRYRNSIPDLVLYINGLPIGVIECKSPIAQNAWDKAYSDLDYYHKNSEKLFHYNQICVGLWEVGARYGAINAPQKFYSVYKPGKDDDLSALGAKPSQQDILIYTLFQKHKLLDLIRNFVIFELDEGRTIKKLPRYQQIRATNKTIAKLQSGEGGVVWHTQGSGKSITMAYVTRKLQAPEYGFNNPTVLVLTDRKDLDQQITNTLINVGFKNINQASSVVHLDTLLRNDYGGIITTTLQKFQETNKQETDTKDQTEQEESGNFKIEKNIEGTTLTKITKKLINGLWVEVEKELIELEELSKKENLYILVDEAHRSHYGFLAAFMRTILPNAKFVAFTGTPISKEDKSTLAEFYGGNYIDVYTIKEAVSDGATVELLYDEGICKLDVRKKELDAEFDKKFADASDAKKDKLKNEALRKYELSSSRVLDVSKHIINHYREKIYPDKFKAMIVCNGREAAVKYQETLVALKDKGLHNFNSKVVISIGSPKSDSIAKDYYQTLEWNREHPDDPKPIYVTPPEKIKSTTEDYKLPLGDESQKEKSGKKKYDNTHIIIVSDMLLTGWDAPVAACMYLDKPLKEHNLLQAIARVNRSREGKNAGFIVDYNGITAYLIQALQIFSGDLKREDILKDLNQEIPRLEANHNKLVEFFKPLKIDRNYQRSEFIDAAIRFIEPIDKRDDFKVLLKVFNKSINIVLPDTRAIKFQKDFKLFNEIKLRAKNAYPDDEELKINKDESKMLQEMIDEHLQSQGVENLLEKPVSIMDRKKFQETIQDASPATKELKIRNNLKHSVKVGLDKNPDFFKPLAQRLEELLKLKKEERITQTELLKAYSDIQNTIIDENKEGEEKGFTTPRQIAVYNTMKTIYGDDAEDATHTIFDLINSELNMVDWENRSQVQFTIEKQIRRFLKPKLGSSEARAKAKEMLDTLKKNKGA